MKVSVFINKVEHKRDIPISWDQVTFGDFLKLDECGQDIIKVIAFLTRMDYEQLKKAKILGLDSIIATLGFLNKPHPLLHPTEANPITIDIIRQNIPNELYGYRLPKDLEFEEVQQYIDLKACVAESRELTPIKQLERYALYCAVYACKQWKGGYSIEAAEELAPVFLNAPCTEVMAVGNFTLLRLIGLNYSINPNSQKAGTRSKRFRLALKGFQIRLGSISQWIIWLKKLGVNKKSC